VRHRCGNRGFKNAKDLLDGPMHAMQGHPEYRAARQAIYEKVHELIKRLGYPGAGS
jgi:hypothetical protein